jgi:hypothetical protein
MADLNLSPNAHDQRPAPPHKTRKHQVASWRGCAASDS